MIRMALALLAVLGLGAAASAVTTVSGVVVGVDSTTKTLFVADSQGRVFLVLAPRVAPVGAVVRVRGEPLTSSWTIVASGTDGRLTRTGSAGSAVVLGELGFVDVARGHFLLGAHGQVVGTVSFPRRLGAALLRLGLPLGARKPKHTLTFHLRIRAGRLSIAGLPH